MPGRGFTTPDGARFVRYIGPGRLRKRIRALAARLDRDYRNRQPVFIGVLNGSFMFCAELAQHLRADCEFDFIKVSSYGTGKFSTGRVKILKDIQVRVRGRDVVLVEDIVETGRSVRFLRKHIGEHHPRTFKVISLLYKKAPSGGRAKPDYVGFTISGHFVAGFGMDYGQKLRNMRGIYRLVEHGDTLQDRE